jgi:hypothetical protein
MPPATDKARNANHGAPPIAAGLLFRPTARAALAGTIAWSLSVWWLGEAITVIFTGVQASTSAASPTAWPPIPTAVRCLP